MWGDRLEVKRVVVEKLVLEAATREAYISRTRRRAMEEGESLRLGESGIVRTQAEKKRERGLDTGRRKKLG